MNPANGSVSIRIQVPVPLGRRLTVPFGFSYDSDGVHHLTGELGYSSWSSNAGQLVSGERVAAGGWLYVSVSRLPSCNRCGNFYWILEGVGGGLISSVKMSSV